MALKFLSKKKFVAPRKHAGVHLTEHSIPRTYPHTNIRKQGIKNYAKKAREKRIGVLGGSFNPPHYGHLLVARQAREKLGLNEVWLSPCFTHAYKKKGLASPQDRLEMVRLACSELNKSSKKKRFKASDLEVKRGSISFTRDTLLELRKRFPDYSFYWILGADLIKHIPHWKNAEGLTELAKFVVMPRPGEKIIKLKKFSYLQNVIQSNASSKNVRARLRAGKSISGLVPKKVLNYIKEKKLYV